MRIPRALLNVFLVSIVLLSRLPAAYAGEITDGWEAHESAVHGLLVSVSFVDNQIGWASGIRSISHTTNGGKTWQSQWDGQQPYWFNNIVGLSPRVALVSGFGYGQRGGVVLRTDDGGASWTPVTVGTKTDADYGSLAFASDRKTGYVISSAEGLLITRDGGVSWRPVTLPGNPARIWIATRTAIAMPDEKTVLVATDKGLARSSDSGATWTLLPFPPEIAGKISVFGYLYFATPLHGWLSIQGLDTQETMDGGVTWVKSSIPGRPYFQDAQHGWAISQYSVFRTEDGGTQWDETVVGGGQDTLVAMTATKQRVFLAGGAEGTGHPFLASRVLPGVTVAAVPDGVVPITFTMPQAGYATIQILNAQGEVVKNLVSGKAFPAGKQTVWWDLSTVDDYWPPFSKPNQWMYEPPIDAVKVAAAGNYRVRGLWHPGLSLKYLYSYYPLKEHGLAWMTPDNTGGWLGDHMPPQDVLRIGNHMWVGNFCEGGDALLESDLMMTKLWGSSRITLACPRVMAVDGDMLYYIDQGGWIGNSLAMIEVNSKTKAARRVWSYAFAKDETCDLQGMAVRGNRLFMADRANGVILVCDLTNNLAKKSEELTVLQRLPAPGVGRIRPYDDTHLAAVVNKSVVLINLTTYAMTPVVTGLTNPLGLGIDTAGNFYVGEMDPVHQVKVFAKDGTPLRTIGKPGKHQVGPFDPDNLESPTSIDIDANGNVWVCELSQEVKRTSVWDAQGHCVNQVLGPTVYGGGGAIDPEDENHLFYQGHEFRRDPKTGKIRLVNLMWRYDDTTYDRFAEQRPHNFGGPCPGYPVRRNGTLFFSMWGAYGMGEVTTLWVYDKDHVRPVAAAGRIPDWLRERLKIAADQHSFAWTDRNADGRVQADELQTGTLEVGSPVWGTRMNDNFEAAFTAPGDHVGLMFFRVDHYTPEGYPVYTVPTEYRMTPNLVAHDPVQTQTVLLDRTGNALVNAPYLFSMHPDGTTAWRYENRWSGLHGGLNTTATGVEPGVLIAPIRFYGAAVVNDQLGEVFCLGSNFGQTDLFTADGLYIGRAFQDCRRSDAWAYNTPPTSKQLSNVSLGQEHFGGTFQRVLGDDKQYHYRYVVGGGGPCCSVVELDGLQRVQRLPDSAITVTPALLRQADLLRQQRAAEMLEQKRYAVTRLANVTVDGNGAEWKDAPRINGFALAYDTQNLYVYYEGADDRAVFQNAATRANFYEAFKKGDVVDLMLATQPGLPANRTEGGTGDIRVSFTMVDGAPAAILYDASVPGTPRNARMAFSSPVGTFYMDRVMLLPTATVAVQRKATSFSLEAKIPLAAIHLDPTATPAIRGDVGLVLSEQTGTRSVCRTYWSNKNTNIVADLPSEARLQPNLWGVFTFGQ